MIYFSLGEIALSLVSALLYGAGFALVAIFLRFSLGLFSAFVPTLVEAVARGERAFSRVKLCLSVGNRGASRARREVGTALLTVAFFIGTILLSYYSLDGAVRIYTVVLSLASAALFYKLLSISVYRLLNEALVLIFSAARIITYPFRRLILRIFMHKKSKKAI